MLLPGNRKAKDRCGYVEEHVFRELEALTISYYVKPAGKATRQHAHEISVEDRNRKQAADGPGFFPDSFLTPDGFGPINPWHEECSMKVNHRWKSCFAPIAALLAVALIAPPSGAW